MDGRILSFVKTAEYIIKMVIAGMTIEDKNNSTGFNNENWR